MNHNYIYLNFFASFKRFPFLASRIQMMKDDIYTLIEYIVIWWGLKSWSQIMGVIMEKNPWLHLTSELGVYAFNLLKNSMGPFWVCWQFMQKGFSEMD